MISSRRTFASIVVVVLVVPAARARAGDIYTSDAPDKPTAAAPPAFTAAPQPPGLAKIEWRDIFWGDRFGRVLHSERPYRNGHLLEGEALYLALDRPDLAEAYRKRREIKTTLRVTSGILLAATAIGAMVVVAGSRGDHAAPAGPFIGIGIGTMLAGGFGIAGACVPSDAVTGDELHRLVDAHNQTP